MTKTAAEEVKEGTMSSDNEGTTSSSESEGADSVKGNATLEFIENLSDVPMGRLPSNIEFQRTRVDCKADAPIHVQSTPFFTFHLIFFLFLFLEFVYSLEKNCLFFRLVGLIDAHVCFLLFQNLKISIIGLWLLLCYIRCFWVLLGFFNC